MIDTAPRPERYFFVVILPNPACDDISLVMDTTILRTFISILDEGSFSAAARRMGISRSLCSKYISDLEADLGARLLTRTTRALRPTALGIEYAQHIREVLNRLDNANEMVRSASGHPAGALKIGAPSAYVHKVFHPHILRFMDDHPDIQMEMVLDDGVTNLVAGGFDAMIRIGILGDSTLHARKLHEAAILLVASPDYLERQGVPGCPADLSQHSCLHYTNLRGSGTWPMRCGEQTFHQKVQPVFSTNNTELLQSLAVSGKGIALLPRFIVAEDLEAGRLVQLLTNFTQPDIPVNLVYPTGKLMTAAMRSFLDFTSHLRLT